MSAVTVRDPAAPEGLTRTASGHSAVLPAKRTASELETCFSSPARTQLVV
jgi:hypothetical protein